MLHERNDILVFNAIDSSTGGGVVERRRHALREATQVPHMAFMTCERVIHRGTELAGVHEIGTLSLSMDIGGSVGALRHVTLIHFLLEEGSARRKWGSTKLASHRRVQHGLVGPSQ